MSMKTIKNLFKPKQINIEPLILEIEEIRGRSEIINICAMPTEYSWLGVYNAGKSLFPISTFAIPQYYSNQLLTDSQLKTLTKKLVELKFSQIIFNGFPSYFEKIVTEIKNVNQNIKIGVIYHGFLAELAQNEIQQKSWQTIINLSNEKKIDKIGFVKANMAQYFEKAFGIKAFLIYNNNPTLKSLPEKKEGINIGVLINHTFRKNIYNQVAAALLIENAKVYVGKKEGLECLGSTERIIEVGHLEHNDFLNLQAQMQLNIHVTFSEASGGQGLTDSLAVGTPCLSSLTHGYLDFNDTLKNALIVDRFEDPYAIYLKAKEVLANLEAIRNLGLEYSELMNKKVEENLNTFLDA